MCKWDHAMYIQCFEDADHLQRAMELKFYQGLTNEHYSGNGLYKGTPVGLTDKSVLLRGAFVESGKRCPLDRGSLSSRLMGSTVQHKPSMN